LSIKVSTAVWKKSRRAGGALLVLLAVADHADDEGRAWPSVGTLAQRARLTERQVRRILNTLVASGELVIETRGGGRNLSNRYRVTVNGDTHVRVSEVIKGDAGDRVSEPLVGSKPGHPRPETLTSTSINPDTHVSRSVMIRHEPLGAAPSPKKLRAKKTQKHPIPDDFSLTAERRAIAEEHGLNPEAFFGNFKDRCGANGYLYKDPDRAWSAWCRIEGLRPTSPFKANKASTMQTSEEYWAKNS
jgi:hypothetical protein